MQKRAQVTTFIVLGIVILAVAGLFVYLRSIDFGSSPERIIENRRASIESRIQDCINEQAPIILDRIGKQGGSLFPPKSVLFNGHRVSYLCYNIDGSDKCSNRILTLRFIEDQISNHLEERLRSCVNIRDFRSSSLSLEDANLEVSTTIGKENTLIIVDYPIRLSRDAASITLPVQTSSLNIPLGRLVLTANAVIESESQVGDFDPLFYSLVHNLVRIEKHRPYPDKVYVTSVRNDDYIFQFAIEGESRW